MGDDERGEFIYKYVSNDRFSSGGDNSSLLEEGKLYAAKFNDDQSGEWLELSSETTGMTSQAEICIFTRMAASQVGATTMDRPEWVASNPNKPELYCALTNNKNRGVKPNAGGDETPANGPNPRPANKYGQIVRWVPEDGDHVSNSFTWDLFLLAGNPDVHSDDKAGSSNITSANMFNSPDGISFDSNGFLWIQTDGKDTNEGDFEGMGNNQMLVADTVSGEIRRFLVGPNECEITGATWSADGRTMFIGVQHPGADGNSHWPDGGTSVGKGDVMSIKLTASQKMQRKKAPKKVRLDADFAGVKTGQMMFIGTPQIIDRYISAIPHGQSRTIRGLRNELARRNKCDAMCPVSTSIFIRMVAEAAIEEMGEGKTVSDVSPFWRVLASDDKITKKLSIDPLWLDEQRSLESS
ncbi:hypothetical protein GQR58_004297 [Nymphon striatum]|nr:hypothetical protein GQR58_004297 [Nymphon striatum]